MISYLASDFFRTSPLLAFPVAALVLFTVLFAANVIRAIAMKPAERDHMARRPLEVDDE